MAVTRIIPELRSQDMAATESNDQNLWMVLGRVR